MGLASELLDCHLQTQVSRPEWQLPSERHQAVTISLPKIGRLIAGLPAFLFCIVPGATAVAMPFEMSSNKIYVPVQINNQGPAWFILDTGSVSNVVDSERARSLKLVQVAAEPVRGAGDGSLPNSIARGVSLQVDGAAMPNCDVAVMPINHAISASEGRSVDGLLGCPFFNRFVVEVDYAARQVHFIDPAKFDFSRENEIVAFEIEGGNIFAKATVTLPNGRSAEGRFLIDTGWRSALSFTSPFVRAQGLPGAVRAISATSGVGIGGPVVSRIGRIGALQLGKFRIENPFVEFSETSNGVLADPGMAGIIGAEVLRRFKVTFDYQRGRMILASNAHFNEPYNFDMSGIYLIAEGKDCNVLKAFSVIANSPASEAGIREGDVIEAIDKQPASNFNLEQVRQMFRQGGREYDLAVRRRSELLPIRIKLRPLI